MLFRQGQSRAASGSL